jgi:hypothetical protein
MALTLSLLVACRQPPPLLVKELPSPDGTMVLEVRRQPTNALSQSTIQLTVRRVDALSLTEPVDLTFPWVVKEVEVKWQQDSSAVMFHAECEHVNERSAKPLVPLVCVNIVPQKQ